MVGSVSPLSCLLKRLKPFLPDKILIILAFLDNNAMHRSREVDHFKTENHSRGPVIAGVSNLVGCVP